MIKSYNNLNYSTAAEMSIIEFNKMLVLTHGDMAARMVFMASWKIKKNNLKKQENETV